MIENPYIYRRKNALENGPACLSPQLTKKTATKVLSLCKIIHIVVKINRWDRSYVGELY